MFLSTIFFFFFDPDPPPPPPPYIRPRASFWVLPGPQRQLGIESTPGVSSRGSRVPSGLFLSNIPLHQFPPISRYFQKVVFLTLFLPSHGQKKTGLIFGTCPLAALVTLAWQGVFPNFFYTKVARGPKD